MSNVVGVEFVGNRLMRLSFSPIQLRKKEASPPGVEPGIFWFPITPSLLGVG